MNAKSFSIVAVVAITLTGLSASAMAEEKPDPEQELYDDCFAKATTAGFNGGEANRMCVKMVAEVMDDDEAKSAVSAPLRRLKLRPNRAKRVIVHRRPVRMRSSRY